MARKSAVKLDLVLCLTATKDGQGQRSNDFSWSEEGESVYFGFRCDGGTPDDRCGCSRAFSGVKSGKATTTARVERRDRATLLADRAAFYETNWKMDKEEARQEAIDDVQNMAVDLRAFEPGDIVESRGDLIQTRRKP